MQSPIEGYEYVIRAKGLVSSMSYPYTSANSRVPGTCQNPAAAPSFDDQIKQLDEQYKKTHPQGADNSDPAAGGNALAFNGEFHQDDAETTTPLGADPGAGGGGAATPAADPGNSAVALLATQERVVVQRRRQRSSSRRALRSFKEARGKKTAHQHARSAVKDDKVAIKGYGQVYRNKFPENAILKTLQNQGPLQISMDGRQLQFYSSGLYSGQSCDNSGCKTCDPKYLTHAMLLVGIKSGAPQGPVTNPNFAINWPSSWIVRNSAGTAWGDNGYLSVDRQSGMGVCGMNRYVYYAVV